MPTIFHLFSPTHLLILASVPLIAFLFAFIQRRYPASPLPRWAMALLLFIAYVMYYGYLFYYGQLSFPGHLPLELCDASLILTLVALLTLNKFAFDLAWYWGVAGASMSLLTPNLPPDASAFFSIQFFADHGLIVTSLLFLIWSRQLRPRPGSVLRAMFALNLLAALIGAFNYLYQTNYMFLRAKPITASLLDLLGPWPWYILAEEFVGIILFSLLYLPFRKLAPTAAQLN